MVRKTKKTKKQQNNAKTITNGAITKRNTRSRMRTLLTIVITGFIIVVLVSQFYPGLFGGFFTWNKKNKVDSTNEPTTTLPLYTGGDPLSAPRQFMSKNTVVGGTQKGVGWLPQLLGFIVGGIGLVLFELQQRRKEKESVDKDTPKGKGKPPKDTNVIQKLGSKLKKEEKRLSTANKDISVIKSGLKKEEKKLSKRLSKRLSVNPKRKSSKKQTSLWQKLVGKSDEQKFAAYKAEEERLHKKWRDFSKASPMGYDEAKLSDEHVEYLSFPIEIAKKESKDFRHRYAVWWVEKNLYDPKLTRQIKAGEKYKQKLYKESDEKAINGMSGLESILTQRLPKNVQKRHKQRIELIKKELINAYKQHTEELREEAQDLSRQGYLDFDPKDPSDKKKENFKNRKPNLEKYTKYLDEHQPSLTLVDLEKRAEVLKTNPKPLIFEMPKLQTIVKMYNVKILTPGTTAKKWAPVKT